MSEKSEIKRDGSKAQKNSGRGKHQKGDAIYRGFLVDYKEYEKSFSLSRDVWAKVCTDAYTVGGFEIEPALKIILGKENEKTRLYVISETMFNQLTEHLDGS